MNAAGRRLRVFLSHTPDALAKYYGDEALAGLREAAEAVRAKQADVADL